MVVFFLHYFLVVVLSFANLGEGQDECTESRCRHHHGPAIRFPFRHKGHQPNHCGYPGFDLYCNEKGQTVLELPSSVKLLVKNINYTSGEILLHDQHGCLPRQLQSLNLSASPFQFKGEPLADYTLFNCSPTNKYRKDSVPCLSALGYHVHAVESFNSITRSHILSCRKLYGFSSVPYEIFNKKFVLLYWSYPKCGACEEKSQRCRVKKNNSTNPETECIPKLDKGATSKWPQVTGGIFFLVLILVIIPGGFSYLEKKEQKKKDMIEKFLEDFKALKPTRYSYADIKNITNQFKDKLGQGGYGTVFKGKISNKIPVAVKVLNNNTGSGEEFKNEVGTIGRIHHVNVVRLVGFCADGIRRALVYEFLPNESLEKFIFSMDYRKHSLGWEKLQDIAIGIAKGIEYLHQGCDQRILHFDIKPHNILLDHNFNPKISDFGLAKLCSKGQSAVSMTAARGTMGYIAPEVLSRNIGNVSYKSDVYSFGMLLLEMVGGRKNTDIRVENTSQVYFPEWIYNHLNQGEELQIRIKEDGDAKIAKKLTIVGLWCIQWYPMERPSMKVVVQMLEGDEDNLAMPPNPFASTIQSTITPERPFSRGLAVISEAN